jgi:serine phosphatase RsbU (regulator of sigma subunit)
MVSRPEGERLDEDALRALAQAIGMAVEADAAVVRLADEAGALATRAVWAVSLALSAELVGSTAALSARTEQILSKPVQRNGEVVGSLELLRARRGFDEEEALLAEMGAVQVGVVLRSIGPESSKEGRAAATRALQLAGLALSAFGDAETAETLLRVAVEAAGAAGGALWRSGPGGVELAVSAGGVDPASLEDLAVRALETIGPPSLDRVGDAHVATVRLGQPPLGALQLVFSEGDAPEEAELAVLGGFGVRAAQALRAVEAASHTTAELSRTRALVVVLGQAISQLSLSHTLETAVERIAELLDVERVAVYLRDGGRLRPVAGRGLAGPHARVADRLLELALGPFRGRETLLVPDAARDRSLAPVRSALAESGIESVLAVPLVAPEAVIGLLAVYPPKARSIDEDEAALIGALAVQLAVAVENARLHEEATRLGAELELALGSERRAARQVRALYEISRSFTHSLSLEATVSAVTRTAVETLDVDAAAIRMLDPRGGELVARSVHVAEETLAASVNAILSRPQPAAAAPIRELLSSGEPLVLDRDAAATLPGHELLVPFLERGSTCVIVPVATPAEVLATLTLVSFDPARPITPDTIEIALTIGGQAALAIDNARLYQQQKGFADTMQRSLLPHSEPQVDGLEVGAVYESSARVDVGGDVYDFITLADGRLAVVLGDVTGHGIEAAADMAMAKFVFRSLARGHPEPADFLASANEVVAGEVGLGKFVTMAYVAVDPKAGIVSCGSAGHPPPRMVRPGGLVGELSARGLALGIEPGESYEEVRERFEPGSAIVLYTDGVVEARKGKEQYGVERLDRLLAERHQVGARELAAEILADCREFAEGELTDDCAVVVIKRLSD